MSKDPAFLFYPGDWLGGTIHFSREEKGAYIDLLMVQFNIGHMTSHMVLKCLGQDADKFWKEGSIKDKFKTDPAGNFFNERLEIEKEKRLKYTKSRKNNKEGKNQYSVHTDGHMTSHMENENTNENEDENRKGVQGETGFIKPKVEDVIAYLSENGINSPIEAEKFVDFYTSKNWMVGKNKMKDWKAAVRNWFRNSLQKSQTKNGKSKYTTADAIAANLAVFGEGG